MLDNIVIIAIFTLLYDGVTFVDMDFLEGRWELRADGHLLKEGSVPRLEMGPGESQSFALLKEGITAEPGAEYWLTVSFRLRSGIASKAF